MPDGAPLSGRAARDAGDVVVYDLEQLAAGIPLGQKLEELAR